MTHDFGVNARGITKSWYLELSVGYKPRNWPRKVARFVDKVHLVLKIRFVVKEWNYNTIIVEAGFVVKVGFLMEIQFVAYNSVVEEHWTVVV